MVAIILAGIEERRTVCAADNLQAGEAMPQVSDVTSHDALVEASHSARVGQNTLSCVSAFKAAICQQTD